MYLLALRWKFMSFYFYFAHIYSLWPFASFWSQPICTLLVMFTTPSHPFSHDPFASFRSQPVCSLSVMTCLHIFGHNPFAHFRPRPVCTFLVMTHSHPLDHKMIVPLRSHYVRTDYDSYMSDQNKFILLHWWHHINIYNCF